VAFLLDTHTLIWWWGRKPDLSAAAREAIESPDSTIFVSAATTWEMATKVRSGRLPEMERRITQYDEGVVEDGFLHLPVDWHHARRAGLLPGAHGDPFDRMIAAQALIEDLTVVSCDPKIAAFGCRTLW